MSDYYHGLLEKIKDTTVDEIQKGRLERAYAAGLRGQKIGADESDEIFELAIKRDIIAKETDAHKLRSLSMGDGAWAILARKRLSELDEERRRADDERFERFRTCSDQELYAFIIANPLDEVAVRAVGLLRDKELLIRIAAQHAGTFVWGPAKRRYWQVLDEEHQHRNVFQRLAYLLSFESMREQTRLGPRPTRE